VSPILQYPYLFFTSTQNQLKKDQVREPSLFCFLKDSFSKEITNFGNSPVTEFQFFIPVQNKSSVVKPNDWVPGWNRQI